MSGRKLQEEFMGLSTAVVADACLRVKVQARAATPGIRPVASGMKVAGRVLPAKHRGSVDVFLEAMREAKEGDVLVVDNDGRTDESCVGDLTILEAKASGLSGVVVRGLHRDSAELAEIAFPVFSYGTNPSGPNRLDPRGPSDLKSASWRTFTVDSTDIVFGDDDGVLFVPEAKAAEVLRVAEEIWETERAQAASVRSGRKLSDQLGLEAYLAKRADDPSYTFRRHLKERGGAIEE